MGDPFKKELPIRSKIEMVGEIQQIIAYLQEGDRSAALPLIEDLKARSLFLESSSNTTTTRGTK